MSDFLTIVFLQGDEADEPFRIWDEEGLDAVTEYLAQWDYGSENDGAALIMGDTYPAISDIIGNADYVDRSGDYWVVRHPGRLYISLIRTIDTAEEK